MFNFSCHVTKCAFYFTKPIQILEAIFSTDLLYNLRRIIYIWGCHFSKCYIRGFSWQCSVQDSVLPLQGVWVQSLIKELRSYMLEGLARKKYFQKNNFLNKILDQIRATHSVDKGFGITYRDTNFGALPRPTSISEILEEGTRNFMPQQTIWKILMYKEV